MLFVDLGMMFVLGSLKKGRHSDGIELVVLRRMGEEGTTELRERGGNWSGIK